MDLIQTQVSLSNIGGKKSMSKILKSFGIAVLMAALLVGTGMAVQTATVSGNVVQSAAVNVLNTTIGFGDFVIGDNTVTTTGGSFINVTTNHDVVLQAVETGTGTNDGKMATTGETNRLTNALKVGIGSFTPVAISGTETTVSSTIDAGSNNATYDGKFNQTIVYPDDVASSYSEVVTFSVIAA